MNSVGGFGRTVGMVLLAAAIGTGGARSQPLPRAVLAPGLADVPDYRAATRPIAPPVVPDGFRALFNGRDLGGWHISGSTNHGTTPAIAVRDGIIVATQSPPGRGGLLVSDESFGDFELYLEARSDWGNDSGVLIRTTEAGAGYQVTLDTLACGSVGRLEGSGGVRMHWQTPTLGAGPPCWTNDPGVAAWKRDDWNVVRIRVEGTAPRVTVSINGVDLPPARDDRNRAVGGAVRGPIALQVHGGNTRWQPAGFWRWRTVAIRPLAPAVQPPSARATQ